MLRKRVQISSGGGETTGPSFPVEIQHLAYLTGWRIWHSFFAQGVSSAQISPAGGGCNLVVKFGDKPLRRQKNLPLCEGVFDPLTT